MTRHMIQTAVIINDIHALFRQLVHNANHPALIAGNSFRGKQERITLRQSNALIFTPRQLSAGGTALTLRPRHQQHQIFARDIFCILRTHHRRKIIKHAAFNRRLNHPAHRPTQ